MEEEEEDRLYKTLCDFKRVPKTSGENQQKYIKGLLLFEIPQELAHLRGHFLYIFVLGADAVDTATAFSYNNMSRTCLKYFMNVSPDYI